MDTHRSDDPRADHELLTASVQASLAAGPGGPEDAEAARRQREALLAFTEERLRQAEEAKEAALRRADEAKEADLRRHDENRAEVERSFGEEVDRYRRMLEELRAGGSGKPPAAAKGRSAGAKAGRPAQGGAKGTTRSAAKGGSKGAGPSAAKGESKGAGRSAAKGGGGKGTQKGTKTRRRS